MIASQCIAIVNVPGGRFSYYAIRLYHATPRGDGVITWRAGARLGPDYASPRRALDAARALASERGLSVLPIRHGTPVGQSAPGGRGYVLRGRRALDTIRKTQEAYQ